MPQAEHPSVPDVFVRALNNLVDTKAKEDKCLFEYFTTPANKVPLVEFIDVVRPPRTKVPEVIKPLWEREVRMLLNNELHDNSFKLIDLAGRTTRESLEKKLKGQASSEFLSSHFKDFPVTDDVGKDSVALFENLTHWREIYAEAYEISGSSQDQEMANAIRDLKCQDLLITAFRQASSLKLARIHAKNRREKIDLKNAGEEWDKRMWVLGEAQGIEIKSQTRQE